MNRTVAGFMKILPNILTLFRILLTCLLIYLVVNYFKYWILISIVFLVIFLTDFLDGKIARLCGNTSRFGAVFDILADLFFVVSSYTALCLFHILPLWFLFILLFKFIEFIATSVFQKKQYNLNSLFIFDLIGRFAAVLFYIVPVLVYLTFMFSQTIYFFTIKYSTFIIIIVTIISSAYRLWNCFQYRINPLSGVDKR